MIILKCANGYVGFTITRQSEADTLTWHCVNDSSTQTTPRTPAGLQQLITTAVGHAVALQGAFQELWDIPEIF